jgi:hypothetical protein
MSERSWHRWAPLSGAVFVVLFIVGFIVSGSSPSSDDPNEKIAAYLAKSSNQTKNIVAFFILLLAMLFLIWFYASLRARLAQAERGDHGLSSLAFGAGIASAVFQVMAISIFLSPIITADDADKFRVDPGIYRLTQDLGYMVWVASTVAGALVAWAASAVILRTGLLPRWFGWFGVVVGIISLFGVFFIPIFVYLLWILIISVLLYMRTAEAPRQPPAGTPGIA